MTTGIDTLRLEQNVRDAYERLATAHIDHIRHLNKKGDGTAHELGRSEAFMEAARAEIQRAVAALAGAISDAGDSNQEEASQ